MDENLFRRDTGSIQGRSIFLGLFLYLFQSQNIEIRRRFVGRRFVGRCFLGRRFVVGRHFLGHPHEHTMFKAFLQNRSCAARVYVMYFFNLVTI